METTTGHEADPNGVNHPAHYNLHPSGVECIDLIRDLGFNIGSAVKYMMRRGDKGDPAKDLDKAIWYLEDYLFDSDGDRRIQKPDYGEIPQRWHWDQLVTHEPDPVARQFYLAIARRDSNSALNAARTMRRSLDG